jgi:hypothetical protein
MNGTMLATLPRLLPKAIAWGGRLCRGDSGHRRTSERFRSIVAVRVGVQRPDLVRIQIVNHLPLPEDLELRQVALNAGLLGEGMIGLTLGWRVHLQGKGDRATGIARVQTCPSI